MLGWLSVVLLTKAMKNMLCRLEIIFRGGRGAAVLLTIAGRPRSRLLEDGILVLEQSGRERVGIRRGILSHGYKASRGFGRCRRPVGV